jgi:hypothetical protein
MHLFPPPFPLLTMSVAGVLLDAGGVALASGQKHICPDTIHTCAVRCTCECRCGLASGALHYFDWL